MSVSHDPWFRDLQDPTRPDSRLQGGAIQGSKDQDNSIGLPTSLSRALTSLFEIATMTGFVVYSGLLCQDVITMLLTA